MIYGFNCLGLGTHFICQGTSATRGQRSDLSVFESSCHLLLPVWSLKGRGNPVKCLAQGHNKRTAGLSLH